MNGAAAVRTTKDYPIPARMKAWVLGGPDELLLSDKPVPMPGRAEVLVRIDAVAICATEIHAGCGQCKRCRQGMYTSCLNYGKPEKGHRASGFTSTKNRENNPMQSRLPVLYYSAEVEPLDDVVALQFVN